MRIAVVSTHPISVLCAIVPGSTDPRCTASKIFPYILAQKPLLAVFHRNSSACRKLEETRGGVVFPFDDNIDMEHASCGVDREWSKILHNLPWTPDIDWDAFERHSAREIARQQCNIFDHVLDSP